VIILCTGIKRSGSTWSYNVALQIAALVFDTTVHCGYVNGDKLRDSIRAVKKGDVGVFKCHDPFGSVVTKIKAGEYHNIITIRHPLDCVASLQTFQDEPLFKSVNDMQICIHRVIGMMGGAKPLVIRYEEMLSGPRLHIQLIAAYMGYELTEDQVGAVHSKTNIEATKKACAGIVRGGCGVIEEDGHLIDVATALHSNHIGDGRVNKWPEQLGAQAEAIKDHLKNEIKFLNY